MARSKLAKDISEPHLVVMWRPPFACYQFEIDLCAGHCADDRASAFAIDARAKIGLKSRDDRTQRCGAVTFPTSNHPRDVGIRRRGSSSMPLAPCSDSQNRSRGQGNRCGSGHPLPVQRQAFLPLRKPHRLDADTHRASHAPVDAHAWGAPHSPHDARCDRRRRAAGTSHRRGSRTGFPLARTVGAWKPTPSCGAQALRETIRGSSFPVAGPFGLPRHTAGIADGEPCLYFVGLPFQTRPASALIGGMGEDAAPVAGEIQATSHR